MLIDPNDEGASWLGRLNSLMNNRKLVSLDMETRSVFVLVVVNTVKPV